MDTRPSRTRKSREKSSRSRLGCERCRRRRQKCDQQKPCCGRCAGAEASCTYEQKLRWGGRAFRKSAFGQCLEGLERLDNGTPDNGFVYSLSQTSVDPTSKPIERVEPGKKDDGICDQTSSPINEITTLASNFQASDIVPTVIPLDQLTPNLPPMARYLLQFYISETMRLTVPSMFAHSEMCRFLVPMALQQPCLLYAAMTFAAVHLNAISELPINAKELIDSLQSYSISHLRFQLAKFDPISRAVSLATTRTLCQVQIYGGNSLWRVHLKGAKAILDSTNSQRQTMENCACASTTERFLSSWYNNAEALAALTPHGAHESQLNNMYCSPGHEVYFDVFGGVMSDLPDLFREVGALVKERRRKDETNSLGATLSESDILVEAEMLKQEIQYRLQRDTAENLPLSPQIRIALPIEDVQDYALSNAAFLYTALLHVCCGVQMLPHSSAESQFCVDKIIWCANNMTSSSGLSPRVLLVAPLFTAGLCAVGPNRVSIESALADIGTWMRTPHLFKTLKLLQGFWGQSAGDTSTHGAWSWFERINLDFLPY